MCLFTSREIDVQPEFFSERRGGGRGADPEAQSLCPIFFFF
jgi:hypothetical protein